MCLEVSGRGGLLHRCACCCSCAPSHSSEVYRRIWECAPSIPSPGISSDMSVAFLEEVPAIRMTRITTAASEPPMHRIRLTFSSLLVLVCTDYCALTSYLGFEKPQHHQSRCMQKQNRALQGHFGQTRIQHHEKHQCFKTARLWRPLSIIACRAMPWRSEHFPT